MVGLKAIWPERDEGRARSCTCASTAPGGVSRQSRHASVVRPGLERRFGAPSRRRGSATAAPARRWARRRPRRAPRHRSSSPASDSRDKSEGNQKKATPAAVARAAGAGGRGRARGRRAAAHQARLLDVQRLLLVGERRRDLLAVELEHVRRAPRLLEVCAQQLPRLRLPRCLVVQQVEHRVVPARFRRRDVAQLLAIGAAHLDLLALELEALSGDAAQAELAVGVALERLEHRVHVAGLLLNVLELDVEPMHHRLRLLDLSLQTNSALIVHLPDARHRAQVRAVLCVCARGVWCACVCPEAPPCGSALLVTSRPKQRSAG